MITPKFLFGITTSFEISAGHNTSDEFAPLLHPDVKFVNIFQQSNEFFKRNCKSSPDPRNRLAINRHFEREDL